MSISRTCRSCGSPLPEHLTDGTCPSCGSAQAGHETPKASGTPADREGDFVVDLPGERTGTHRPEADVASTVVAEGTVRAVRRAAPRLAGYRDVAWLNGGGMGDVYRGIQTGTERRVAIKVMRATVGTHGQGRERFENEIRALGRVDHPGVVRVYECGECDHGPYFSMEFVEGETLAKRVKRDGPLPPLEAVRIVRIAAEAVHCAHRVDVLHRDIKPSNVMIAPDGTVKVTDFGLAKHTDETDDITATGMVIGTPSYIPPEQAEGRTDRIGPASDVYGLGATLYHLLTGCPPHTTQSTARALRGARVGDVVPPTERRPDLCPVLGAIVEKSLANDPARRYASAEAFARELANWAAGEPTIAMPPTALQRFGRRLRRHRIVLAVFGLVFVLAAAVAIVRHVTDEKGAIERALARGEAVTLVGETGGPRWHEWVLLPGLMGKSQDGKNALGMQSQRYTGLMLVEDPMTDHYRFRTDILHYGGMRADETNKTTNHASKIGLFWGYRKLLGQDGATADTMFSLDFNDLTRNTKANPNADDEPRPLRVHARSFPNLPDVGLKDPEIGLPVVAHFLSKGEKQSIWRTLEIEVHPERVTVSFAVTAGKPPRIVGSLSREQLEDGRATMERRLNEKGGAGWTVPEWTPRRPLGILGLLSTISIRNAVIEPLPTPVPTPPAP
ncbi:MAG: serine/threonine protein kinase [Gemmataceae bacterium]|nr:serine/threonine protein kinase [Gemmataceae bacterium]